MAADLVWATPLSQRAISPASLRVDSHEELEINHLLNPEENILNPYSMRSRLAITALCTGLLAGNAIAQPTPPGVIPVTSEPQHKVRFDNGVVQVYELMLPKGNATRFHEHRTESFAVILRNAENITNEPFGGKPVVLGRAAGAASFASTANGPWLTHTHIALRLSLTPDRRAVRRSHQQFPQSGRGNFILERRPGIGVHRRLNGVDSSPAG